MSLRSQLGMLRSRLMYYGNPIKNRRLRRFYGSFIPPGALCFDIGAHLGNRIAAFAALGARVIAVEPQPACIEYLHEHFYDNIQVTVVPHAIGASPGMATLHISQLSPTISTLASEKWRDDIRQLATLPVDWEEQMEVKLLTLDQLIDTYGLPDFCKIDVEDYEAEVLKGLSHPIPMLSFEFFTWTHPRTLECLDLIDRLGSYEYNWSVGESHRMVAPQWLTASAIDHQLGRTKKKFSGDIYARRC